MGIFIESIAIAGLAFSVFWECVFDFLFFAHSVLILFILLFSNSLIFLLLCSSFFFLFFLFSLSISPSSGFSFFSNYHFIFCQLPFLPSSFSCYSIPSFLSIAPLLPPFSPSFLLSLYLRSFIYLFFFLFLLSPLFFFLFLFLRNSFLSPCLRPLPTCLLFPCHGGPRRSLLPNLYHHR